jgi:LDH2 family malate/lactate/ureidoglycolate dehydrogenase
MIELMAGPLIGDLTSAESLTYDDGVGGAPCHGELVLALSPDVFLGHKKRECFQRAERLFSLILAQGARLPSQRRFQARLRSVSYGVTITRIQYDILMDLLEA